VWGTRSEGKLGLGDDLLSGDEGEPRLLDMMSAVQGRAVACGRAHTVALCSRRLMAEQDSRFCLKCQKEFNWSRRPKHCHRLENSRHFFPNVLCYIALSFYSSYF
jgi:hypothetical protein